MRRRVLMMTALTMTAMLFVGVQPAFAGRLSEEIPSHLELRLDEFCGGDQVVLDQRDPRTLTTWTDRNGHVVLQTLKTDTTNFLTRADGVAMDLEERSLVAVKPDARGGDSSILWIGRGAIWGDDKSAGGPFLLWVTGIVLMKGSYDPKTGIFALSSKTIIGQQTDLCLSIEEGLKPRH